MRDKAGACEMHASGEGATRLAGVMIPSTVRGWPDDKKLNDDGMVECLLTSH